MQYLKKWLLVLAVATLGACGSSSDDDSEPVPQDTARLRCQVNDASTGRPVEGATLRYQGKTGEHSATTNADGSCVLDLPPAEVAGVRFPAATVTKPGYEPQTVLCASLQAGASCNQNVSLIPLAANVSIPVGGDTVWHLGDENFLGSANSQFQKPTDGVELSFAITDWAAQTAVAGVSRATVYLDAKGWQSNVCNNLVELVGDVGTVSQRGGVSPTEGYWAGGRQTPFVFDVAAVGRGQATLRLVAGECNGIADRDDFEVNRIRVEFN